MSPQNRSIAATNDASLTVSFSSLDHRSPGTFALPYVWFMGQMFARKAASQAVLVPGHKPACINSSVISPYTGPNATFPFLPNCPPAQQGHSMLLEGCKPGVAGEGVILDENFEVRS